VIWSFIEIIRIRLGTHGNKHMDISKLSVFLLLSIFLQPAFIIYLGFFERNVLPIERSLCVIGLFFIVFEIILAYDVLRRVLIRKADIVRFQESKQNNLQACNNDL